MGRKTIKGNVDPTLRALGKLGRYQLLQQFVINLGSFAASYQLLGNIFIGHTAKGTCAAPRNGSDIPQHLLHVDWNSSQVSYGACEMIIMTGNASSEPYPCLFGHDYDYPSSQSFRTEFDLVCDRKLLGGLVQSFVIMGQGIGAVIASLLSDRFGRKKVQVGSNLGLLVFGMSVGLAPNYVTLCALRFIVGAFQQGVVTTGVTLPIELFPSETRSVTNLWGSTMWGVGSSSMALVAFLMQDYSWRHLQFALSSVSLLAFFQWWYADESLRWLVANGRKEEALKVLERASRTNKKRLSQVIKTLESSTDAALIGVSDNTVETKENHGEKIIEHQEIKKMTVLDLFRHKRLLGNAVVMWLAWFTTALSFFTLYMMSTSLHGNRFLNYFLTALMEIPPSIIFWIMVDRVGRKNSTRFMVALAGIGLVSGSVFRTFKYNPVCQTLSVVSAMLGMCGASGMFGAVFFYTPELFPTNMRNQAIGVSSFAGRCGGVLAPFMASLADVAMWAPGATIGSLCLFVIIAMYFLPETKGRELPNTVEEIENWHKKIDDTFIIPDPISKTDV